MLHARVRTRDVYLEMWGQIPSTVLAALREEFGRRLIVRCPSLETFRDILNAACWKVAPVVRPPAAYVRFFRQERGLSQARLGRLLGNVPRQNISGMERGTRPIGKDMALRLARVFEVSPDRFIQEGPAAD